MRAALLSGTADHARAPQRRHHPQRRGRVMSVDAPTSPREVLDEGADRAWRMYIGGEQVEAHDGRWTDVMSASSLATVRERICRADAADVERAVQVSRKALPGWR